MIAVVLAVVVFNKLLGGGSGGGKTTSVPNITNLSVSQATSKLTAAGLKLGSSTCSGDAANSTTVAAGLIISQQPANGSTATTGTAVNYCVSAGATQKKLPDIGSLNTNTKATVEQTLNTNGFTNLQESDQANSTIPAGNVIDLQDTNGKSIAGQAEPVTMQIVVVVSSGPGNATVPPTLGQSCTQAAQTIQGAGFQTQTINQFSNDVQNGNVISTDPGGNASAARGSTVKIYCSTGASPSPTPSASASSTSSAGGFLGGLGGPTQSPGANGGN